MVVSKDSKRRRKETETSPPPPPTAVAPTTSVTSQQASTTAVESSPEMPKRTKVQAQRKFAQGQSAPTSTSAFSALAAAAAGPSTSAESREPPIEILPNKRPKTQDFLTFLCFRGTSTLPPHLDYLNQGNSKESETTTKKNNKTPSKPNKKGKRGRPKANAKNNAAVATAAAKTTTPSTKGKNEVVSKSPTTSVTTNDKKVTVTTSPAAEPKASFKSDFTTNELAQPIVQILPGAVRKRAEVVTEGNRRGRRSGTSGNVETEKCNSNNKQTLEAKRRSNRQSTKEGRPMIEPDTDEEEDEYFSAHAESSKAIDDDKKECDAILVEKSILKIESKTITRNTRNTSTPVERNSETPSKDSETGKSTGKRVRPASVVNKKSEEITKTSLQKTTFDTDKSKGPVKRARQRESPIFIPSPESSGRMTRQRAFFEPVKVTPNLDNDESNNTTKEELKEANVKNEDHDELEKSDDVSEVKQTQNNKEVKANSSIYAKEAKILSENGENGKGKTSLNVFDFSSDDEQPLAKSIKLKKGKASPKKQGNATTAASNARGRKSATKKSIGKDSSGATADNKNETPVKVEEQQVVDQPENDAKVKPKRGRGAKKKADESLTDTEIELTPPSPKKATNTSRQSRGKAKSKPVEENESKKPGSPEPAVQRNQRPSRKTKEAAAIYMNIIGHKLQLADDEEDDLSLSSFPDIPNVKEMEKMENEIKKNAAQTQPAKLVPPTSTPTVRKPSPKPPPQQTPRTPTPAAEVISKDKPVQKPAARRGRPPKQAKLMAQLPPKREIEGMLVKKGALAKIATTNAESLKPKAKSEHSNDDDEDFLINEELNETKRKLEKSFSDSDDEPLAIKVNVKGSDKDANTPLHSPKSECTPEKRAGTTIMTPTAGPVLPTTPLTMLPLTTKHTPSPIMASSLTATSLACAATTTTTSLNLQQSMPQFGNSTSPLNATSQQPTPATFSPLMSTPAGIASGLKVIEKKSPVPTSKILNVPATYALPGTGPTIPMGAGAFNKTSPYLPQASPHYHTPYVRPPPTPTHQFSTSTAKSPTTTQSPLKYQTPPTTYPPPIEAYQCPKINPNFLTPKFDRTTLPRTSNFPSPSPVKFDTPRTVSGIASLASPVVSITASPAYTAGTKSITSTATVNLTTTNASPSTSAAAAAAAAAAAHVAAAASAVTPTITNATSTPNTASADPLKDEIGSILAANLMPSKEESGKIFGIASVSLAQSSGPDNTKCTLGKCGSIHKPVLGPVVPTEGYFGDQLSSKERRKAKVNMTHEQIQKWLIECSSNPDEIQDDLDDDFDDSLRPNQSTTPPPTRDDKESTSFSSSSKNTRELGKSESAWSAKGPSLKATPVVASSHNRKEEEHKQLDVHDLDYDKSVSQAVNLTQKTIATTTAVNDATNATTTATMTTAAAKEQNDKKSDKKGKDGKASNLKESSNVAGGGGSGVGIGDSKKQTTIKMKPIATTTTTTAKLATTAPAANDKDSSATENNSSETPSKQNRNKKNAHSASASSPTTPSSTAAAAQKSSSTTNTTSKRTPVYNQKAQKQQLQQQQQQQLQQQQQQRQANEGKTSTNAGGQKRSAQTDSVYAFDKDDDSSAAAATPSTKPAYRRQGRNDPQPQEESVVEAPAPIVPNALSERSPTKKRAAAAAAATAVSLTLSPTENCKLVKVSLDAPSKTTKATRASAKKSETAAAAASVPTPAPPSAPAAATTANADADSDGDGATFYIPLQGAGVGGKNDGGIQGVAVKLGREGPDGPNQKVVMQATLVTKAQMDTNSKPLPDSLNTTELVKTLLNATNADQQPVMTTTTASGNGKKANATGASASTSAAAVVGGTNSASNSLKNVPIGSTGQTRFKDQPSTSNSVGLVRVNSNSSLFSGSAKSRNAAPPTTNPLLAKKFKDDTPIKMANNTAFPRHDDPTQMVEAPIFRPTEKEFADPIEFIERITPIAARFGICKIIPPTTFKPECRISDEMRFTAYNQYVHKMLHRWGPSAKELSAIKKYLATQSITMTHPPWIGGMEVDLPRLYHTVQELGGLKEVIEKKKWARVAEEMCIPKLAQDRVTKLDDIYCKYLLPYDTLSPAERQKLFDEVEADWAKREARARRNADRFVNTESVSNEEDDVSSDEDDESEEEIDGVSMECIVKGRSMPLSQFYRIARNTMALWFKNADPTVNEVEAEFWRHVAVRDSHVCVHSGSIDSSGWGYGFPSPGPKGKGSNYARHPWNLKVLTNNAGSVLRSLGPVMGVTVPTLHVGMLFSACCWYRDPHGLSWIEYLHTGASKLWYGIPDDQSSNFRAALTSLIPTHCQNKTIWLPCDTVMVPPHMLTDRGVSLCRIEQKPGEFIVIFPRAYTSSLATGYVVSESVYFATMSWLDLAKDDFRDIHESCEPAMFSLEQLLFALGYDQRVNSDTLQQMLPMLNDVCEKETAAREQLKAAGVTSTEKIQNEKGNKAKKQQPPHKSIESECDLCRANLYISMVRTEDGNVYCLQHALKNLNNGNIQAKQCKLIYAFNVDDIQQLIKSLKDKIQQKRTSVVSKKSK